MKTEPRKTLPLLLVLTLGLSACGGSGGSTPGTAGGGTGGGLTTAGGAVLSTTPVSSAPLDKASLTTFSQNNSAQVVSNVTQLATGSGFALSGITPMSLPQSQTGTLSLKGLTLVPQGLIPQGMGTLATDPCVNTSGNTTDADKDGIYADYKATFNCNTTSNGTTLQYQGTGYLHDKNDNDPKSGFHFDIDSSGTAHGVSNGTTTDTTLALKLLLEVDQNSSGGYKARSVYNFDLNAKATGSSTATLSAKAISDTTLESVPDTNGKGTTVSVSGSASTAGSYTSASGSSSSGSGAATYSGQLHYSLTCGGIDSGSLTYSSGGNTVTYTYTGCKTVSAK